MGTDSGDDSDMLESISTFWKVYFSKPKPKKQSVYTIQPCLDQPSPYEVWAKEDAEKVSAIDALRSIEEPTCSARYDIALGKSITDCQNIPFLLTPHATEHTSEKVWVYNVSALEHRVSHPLLNGEVIIPRKDNGSKYCVWTSFPLAMNAPRFNVDSSEIDFIYQDGRRFVMDLIDPDNLGLDQAEKVTARIGSNRNLGEKGVFWSVNNPPKPEELLAARKRMGKFYKRLLEEVGTKIFTSGMTYNEKVKALVTSYRKDVNKASTKELKQLAKLKLANWLTITPEHHAAAEYFKQNTEWHPISESRLRRTKQCQ